MTVSLSSVSTVHENHPNVSKRIIDASDIPDIKNFTSKDAAELIADVDRIDCIFRGFNESLIAVIDEAFNKQEREEV